MEYEINDIREQKHFKGISFSKFKKTDVKKELLNSLINSKMEPACYWSAELICAGHYYDIWDIIMLFYSKYIHLGNPKISTYLELRLVNFKTILKNGYVNNELRMRNSDKIRKLFCEIMCILCDAKKKHSFDNIKITKNDFDLTQMTDRFKAPNTRYAEPYFRNEDPYEIFIALNELIFNLSDGVKNIINACYWIEWIIEFENVCNSKNGNGKIKCGRRANEGIEPKYQMDVIWVVWDVFLKESEKKSQIMKKIITALLTLFSLKYTTSCYRRRKNIVYFVVSILCENVNYDEEIIRECQKNVLTNVLKKIDLVYKQIKINEESPETDYLFNNLNASNLEKTIEKLSKMNNFGETFIPRV